MLLVAPCPVWFLPGDAYACHPPHSQPLVSPHRGQRLHIINCNQHTEVSDFLGGFRPNRHRERSLVQLQAALAAVNASPLLSAAGQAALPPPPTPTGPDLQAAVAGARQRLEAAAAHVKAMPARSKEGKAAAVQLEQLRASVAALAEAAAGVRAPFEWADGPLVQAMKCGDMILIDELNLAEDAVLERLNRWAGLWLQTWRRVDCTRPQGRLCRQPCRCL